MSKEIRLKEYEFLQSREENSCNEKAHYINAKCFIELEDFVLQNEETALYLKLTTKKGFGKVLQAQNYVGLIQTKDSTSIEILPKIKNVNTDESKTILIKMLKSLRKSPFKHFNKAHLKSSKMPLLEIFIAMFLEELSALIRKGIKSEYIVKEENLHFLKGKLKVGEQIKRNAIHKERFFVEHEEFLSDRVENRLIKSTLEYLYKKSKRNKNQQLIREFLFVFDSVQKSRDIKNDFSKVRLNRAMKAYEVVLLWAKTFLLENSFSPYKGDSVAFALLFDMNLLFESYIGAYLKKKGLQVSLQDKGKYLVDSHKSFALRPDIVIDKGSLTERVADTKYKNISNPKDISQSDMYQLYAYGTKYVNTSQLYLIYPKSSQSNFDRYSYIEDELHLDILFFDLQKDFTQEIGL